MFRFLVVLVTSVVTLCAKPLPEIGLAHVNPRFITDPVRHDSDDIQIWIHPDDPAQSLLLGTDKNREGALVVFNLRGEELVDKTVRGLARPNNVDVLQGIQTPRGVVDIAVVTERNRHQLRVFSLPDMRPLDGGGLPVFENALESPPMGIALWQRPTDGVVFATVSGKTGPSYGYLRQYALVPGSDGSFSARLARVFGNFSGFKEIEAITVDREHGWIFYSDESYGIRKYHADPDHPDAELELAVIRTPHFAGDVEGLSIYDAGEGRGYLMASDQSANRMHFFRREGTPGNPHVHDYVFSVNISAQHSDGNLITARDLSPLFPSGLMVAMSEGRTFHLYHWDAVAGKTLTVAPDARPVVHWIWSGAVTADSARVVALLGHKEDVVLLVSEEDDFSPARRIAPTRLIEDPRGWIAHFDVDGLDAGTLFHYIVERKGRVIWQHAGAFRTFPAGPANLRVAMGSCAATGSNHPVFDTIRGLQPDFFLHLGDLHYEDIAINDADLFKQAFHSVLTAPRQAALYRSVPIAYMWDDHDYGPNNSDSTSPSRPAAMAAYRAAVPHYPLVTTDPEGSIQQAFTFGRVRFVMADGRSMRSARNIPDGPQRTQLGAAQLAWLKQELAEASRTHALVVWVNTVPWIGEEPNYDRWSGFQHERRILAEFLEEQNIRNVVMVSGDAHMVAIDDGSNNRYGPSGAPLFPILHAAALDRRGSIKGGPYSHGPLPGPGQFGVLEVFDAGGDSVEVVLKGMNAQGEVLLQHRFEVPLGEK